MIKTKSFWIAAICLAIIPLLIVDIAQHYLDWKTEVREEIITMVQNVYSFDRQQKADILDKLFERNATLTFLMYSKSFFSLILFGSSLYFFRVYRRQQNAGFLKPVVSAIALVLCFMLVKIYAGNQLKTNPAIQFLKADPNDLTLEGIYNQNFKGKVLYIDFWGTTCGPCLQEFRDFTQPLKDRYRDRHDIAYLYVAQGNQYLWKAQIGKYKVEGFHVFVNENQYEKLYRHATRDSTGSVLMPRYLIIGKTGNIVETNAAQPDARSVLYNQLDKYLAEN